MHVTDLAQAFAAIHTHWDPHIVGELNGQMVKCVKLKGEFVWHQHDHEDEMFLVHRGTLEIRLRDRTLHLRPGQFCIIPRGVEHQPFAVEEVEVVLFEPATTLNTGNVTNALTKTHLKKLESA
jgi:mannose-6-phosphate isomerase-like protein (cupin superfamily)